MALQKQIAQTPIVGGLDTKTDQRVLTGTSFLELENWRFTKTGSLTKRNGFNRLTQNVQGAARISSGKAVSSFKDELLLFDGSKVYTYFDPEKKWIEKGAHENTLSRENAVYNLGADVSAITFTTFNNISVYVLGGNSLTTSANAQQTVVVVDQNTQEIISTFAFDGYGTAYSQISVAALNGRFYIFYKVTATEFAFRYIESSDLYTISDFTTLGTYDLIYTLTAFGNIYVLLTDIGAPGVARIIDPNFSIGAVLNLPTANYTIKASTEGRNIRLAYIDNTNDLVSTLYTDDLILQLHAPVDIEAAGTVDEYCVVQSATNTSIVFYTWRDNSNNNSMSIYKRPVYYDGSRGTKTLSQYGGKLESEVFYDNTSLKFYYLCSKPYSVLYQTFYLAADDGIGTSMISQFGAGNAIKSCSMHKPIKIGFSLFFSSSYLSGAQDLNYQVRVPNTAMQLEADFSQRFNYFDEILGNNLYVSGGILKNYDGYQLVEHGFLETPENGRQLAGTPTVAGDNDVGTLVSDIGDPGLLVWGTYQVTYLYVYRDRFGQVYRSAPAVPWSVVVDATNVAVNGEGGLTHYARTPTFTDKIVIEIEWYRTEVNGSILYKITNQDNTFEARSIVMKEDGINAWVQWPIADYEAIKGNDLISSEVIYTEGGELEVNAPAASRMITAYKNRLFLLSSDGRRVYYSKQILPNSPAEFSDSFYIDLDNSGGDGISISSIDDYVVIFKERSIFVFGGEGPSSLGEQNDYRRPVEVNTDAGCIEPNSIARYPTGLMFKSNKGIYSLSRSLAVEYTGAPVERYNSFDITSATLIEGSNEVRFTCSDSRVLVYDYYHKFWTTFSPMQAIDSVNHQGIYYWLRADGKLYAETAGLYTDDGSFIKTRLRSAWIQFAGLQGYQRFYSLQLLGEYKSKHKLKVQFAYDYDPALLQASVIPVYDRLNPVAYGSGVYGNGPYGGTSLLYQWEIRPKIQKCQSFQIVIEDVQDGLPGESMLLSAFAIEMGINPGTQRTPVSGRGAAS